MIILHKNTEKPRLRKHFIGWGYYPSHPDYLEFQVFYGYFRKEREEMPRWINAWVYVTDLEVMDKKLEIAVNALEYYEIPFNQFSPVYNIAQHHKRAEEALVKIKEIK